MENWKDKVIGSLDGMERVTPPADTFQKIQKKIATQKNQEISVSRFHVAAVAAAILIAVTANIFVISTYSGSNSDTTTGEQSEYSSILSNYNLY